MINKTAILNAVKVLENNGILGLPYIDGSIQMKTRKFITQYPFNSADIITREDVDFPYEARVEDGGVIFFTLLTEKEYQEYREGGNNEAL